MSIPISTGSGVASVAADAISGLQYQQIKVVGAETGSTSTLGITPDGSAKVSVVGTVTTTASGAGSVITVIQNSSLISIVTGSVVALPTGNQSVSGTVGASVIGITPVNPVGNSSVITYVQNSVATVIIGGSIAASVTPPANQSVSGTVDAAQIGTWRTSVIGSVPSSLLVGASIFGALPAGDAVIGAVAASISGTVPVTLSGNPSISGTVNTIWTSPSIVGSYAEDAAHTTGEKGLFALGVRNDTLSSVTSADNDYSQVAVGPDGAATVHEAPITKWLQGTADLRVVLGASVQAIAAQGASVFTYITGVQLANMGSASVLVTFTGGLGSVLAYSIAPAGGGSNIIYRPALKTGENSGFSASISGTASVLVSAQGFSAKI